MPSATCRSPLGLIALLAIVIGAAWVWRGVTTLRWGCDLTELSWIPERSPNPVRPTVIGIAASFAGGILAAGGAAVGRWRRAGAALIAVGSACVLLVLILNLGWTEIPATFASFLSSADDGASAIVSAVLGAIAGYAEVMAFPAIAIVVARQSLIAQSARSPLTSAGATQRNDEPEANATLAVAAPLSYQAPREPDAALSPWDILRPRAVAIASAFCIADAASDLWFDAANLNFIKSLTLGGFSAGGLFSNPGIPWLWCLGEGAAAVVFLCGAWLRRRPSGTPLMVIGLSGLCVSGLVLAGYGGWYVIRVSGEDVSSVLTHSLSVIAFALVCLLTLQRSRGRAPATAPQ